MHTDHTPTPPPDPEQDRWLEIMLRNSPATPPGVRAAGDDAAAFTARVLGALPEPVPALRRRGRLRRTVIVLGATAAGAACAAGLGGPSLGASSGALAQLAIQGLGRIQDSGTQASILFAAVSAVAMLLVGGRRTLRGLLR